MKARDFDTAFDKGGDVSDAIDWSAASRPNFAARRVNVDFPAWIVEGLDARAAYLGVTRQALIKMWIAEHLEAMTKRKVPMLTTDQESEAFLSQNLSDVEYAQFKNVSLEDWHVGRRIRHKRWMVDMTQQQLGNLIGVSVSSVQGYESGTIKISAGSLWHIANALDVPVGFFYEGMVEPAQTQGSEGGDLLADKEALELVRSYYALPEAQRRKLFDAVEKLKGVA